MKQALRDGEVDVFNREHHASWDDVEFLLATSERAARETLEPTVCIRCRRIPPQFCAVCLEAELAARAQEPQQWQPIETAPKDGTQLLLALAGTDRVNRGFWWTEDESSVGHWFMVGGGWTPTHWMPLPAAPSRPAGAAQEE